VTFIFVVVVVIVVAISNLLTYFLHHFKLPLAFPVLYGSATYDTIE